MLMLPKNNIPSFIGGWLEDFDISVGNQNSFSKLCLVREGASNGYASLTTRIVCFSLMWTSLVPGHHLAHISLPV